jgi:hypothetical protein
MRVQFAGQAAEAGDGGMEGCGDEEMRDEGMGR